MSKKTGSEMICAPCDWNAAKLCGVPFLPMTMYVGTSITAWTTVLLLVII